MDERLIALLLTPIRSLSTQTATEMRDLACEIALDVNLPIAERSIALRVYDAASDPMYDGTDDDGVPYAYDADALESFVRHGG